MNKISKVCQFKQTKTSILRQSIADEKKRPESAVSKNGSPAPTRRKSRPSSQISTPPTRQDRQRVHKKRPANDYGIETRSKTRERNYTISSKVDNTAIEQPLVGLQQRYSLSTSHTSTQGNVKIEGNVLSNVSCCRDTSCKYEHVERDHETIDKVHWPNNKVGTNCERQAKCGNEKDKELPISDPCTSNARKSHSTTVKHNEKGTAYVKHSKAEIPLEYHEANADFYQNKIKSHPSGCLIEDMLKWYGDHARLERNHSYIQWLFPLPETRGMNSYAQQLYPHEEKIIKGDKMAYDRVLQAYKMMLDFYGMKLKSEKSGDVQRSSNWQERYTNLLKFSHNNRRITRIISSIGYLGYEHFQARLVDFLLTEVLIEKKLEGIGSDTVAFWIDAVFDTTEQQTLNEKFRELDTPC